MLTRRRTVLGHPIELSASKVDGQEEHQKSVLLVAEVPENATTVSMEY